MDHAATVRSQSMAASIAQTILHGPCQWILTSRLHALACLLPTQAELQLALNNYSPKAVIDHGTPADKMLSMLTELLDGTVPSIQDILFVQVR